VLLVIVARQPVVLVSQTMQLPFQTMLAFETMLLVVQAMRLEQQAWAGQLRDDRSARGRLAAHGRLVSTGEMMRRCLRAWVAQT
jgi:hypothetical protein